MAKYGLLVNVDNCTGCYNCVIACKDEHSGNAHLPIAAAQPEAGHTWVRVEPREQGTGTKVRYSHVPISCQQCEDAPCIEAAQDNAVYRRDDGIVVIDPKKAVGQKQIAESCPYGAIYWNDELNVAQKCTFCAHLLDQGWAEPRCVESCPVNALVFGDLEDPNSRLSQLVAADNTETLQPELGLNPLVSYVGLPRPFIAGEVVCSDQPDECAVGASVTLSGISGETTLVTNSFGDFRFDNLDEGASYSLRIEHDGYSPVEKSVTLSSAALNLEAIELTPS